MKLKFLDTNGFNIYGVTLRDELKRGKTVLYNNNTYEIKEVCWLRKDEAAVQISYDKTKDIKAPNWDNIKPTAPKIKKPKPVVVVAEEPEPETVKKVEIAPVVAKPEVKKTKKTPAKKPAKKTAKKNDGAKAA